MAIERKIVGDQRPQSASERRMHQLALRAGEQYGVVARHQLLGMGFSRDQIKRMLGGKRLHPLHRGVYAVGHRALHRNARWVAAVLASGPDALLGHRSGAGLRGIRRTGQSIVEVTVPQRRGDVPGIRSYVCGQLAPQDRDVVDRIPCTSLALTLLNLAAVLPRRQVERACDEALVQEVLDLNAIEDVLRRFRGCRGAARLRSVLDEHDIGTTLTRPGLEEKALVTFDSFGIPRPMVNAMLGCGPGISYEVDFLWRAERLVLETDGDRFHHMRWQIERDRRKEADLVRAGYRVLRATWWQIERDPQDVVTMLRAALQRG
jgi:hypothetical protein